MPVMKNLHLVTTRIFAIVSSVQGNPLRPKEDEQKCEYNTADVHENNDVNLADEQLDEVDVDTDNFSEDRVF